MAKPQLTSLLLPAMAMASSASSPWCQDPTTVAAPGMYCGDDESPDCLAASLVGVTVSDDVRILFESGLAQEWNFNQFESKRNFARVVDLAPDCAICRWGLARSHASQINANINDFTTFNELAENALAALKLSDPPKVTKMVQSMQLLKVPPEQGSNATAVAMARQLYADDLCAAAHDDAFADDPDIGALCADAAMATSSWNYYENPTMDKGPSSLKPYFQPIWELLQKLTAPSAVPNALAQHLMIHISESRNGAYGSALYGADAADALVDLLPKAGHLQHMPAHLYLRNGHYASGLKSSLDAIAADHFYMERCLCPYAHSHNIDMGIWHAMLLGDSASSIHLAQVHKADEAMFQAFPPIWPGCFYMVTNHSSWEALVYTRFGRFHDVMRLGYPSCEGISSWLCTRHLPSRLFAYGMAAEALQQQGVTAAPTSDAAFEALSQLVGGNNPADAAVAGYLELAARRAFSQGDLPTATGRLTNLTAFLENRRYGEPPIWYYPTWDCLGYVKLQGSPETSTLLEAVAAFEMSLSVFPRSGWALLGLHQAHTALGHTDRATAFMQQYEAEFQQADVELHSACPQFGMATPVVRQRPPPPAAPALPPAITTPPSEGVPPFVVFVGFVAGVLVTLAFLYCFIRWRRGVAIKQDQWGSLIPQAFPTSTSLPPPVQSTSRIANAVDSSSIGEGIDSRF